MTTAPWKKRLILGGQAWRDHCGDLLVLRNGRELFGGEGAWTTCDSRALVCLVAVRVVGDQTYRETGVEMMRWIVGERASPGAAVFTVVQVNNTLSRMRIGWGQGDPDELSTSAPASFMTVASFTTFRLVIQRSITSSSRLPRTIAIY